MAESTGFYTLQDISRLAQIPMRTLYEWREREIITPTLVVDDDGKRIAGYSYADLTIIRVIRALRDDQIDFRAARIALRHLYERLGPPDKGWADATVYFIGKRIYAHLPDDWEVTAATEGGQKVETRLFGDVFTEVQQVEEGASILVPREFREYVTIDPDVMSGEPVVRGTRIPTRMLAILARAGESAASIARTYNTLSRSVIEKALAYESYLDSWASSPRAATAR